MVQLAARLILIQKVPRSSRGRASRLGRSSRLVTAAVLKTVERDERL